MENAETPPASDQFDEFVRTEVVAQNLHVAGQHDEIDAVVGQGRENFTFLARFGLGVDRKVRIGDAHVLADARMVRVIRHDDTQVHVHLAASPSGEQVVQAVRLSRRKNRRRSRHR